MANTVTELGTNVTLPTMATLSNGALFRYANSERAGNIYMKTNHGIVLLRSGEMYGSPNYDAIVKPVKSVRIDVDAC